MQVLTLLVQCLGIRANNLRWVPQPLPVVVIKVMLGRVVLAWVRKVMDKCRVVLEACLEVLVAMAVQTIFRVATAAHQALAAIPILPSLAIMEATKLKRSSITNRY